MLKQHTMLSPCFRRGVGAIELRLKCIWGKERSLLVADFD